MKPVAFLSEVQTELKRVVWPDRQQVVKLTISVLIISALVGAFLGILDYTFTSQMQHLLK